MKEKSLNRRNFLKVSFSAGVGITFSSCSTGYSSQLKDQNQKLQSFENFWVKIPETGNLEFTCPRTEMGQGISTGHAALLCESLDYPLDLLVVKNADGNRVYDHKEFRAQMTGGSTSTQSEWKFILNIGESIRQGLLKAASKRLGIPVNELKSEDGFILAGDKRISYQSLSQDLVSIDLEEVEFDITKLKQAKYVGKKVKRVDGKAKIRGEEKYGIDTKDFKRTKIENPYSAVFIASPLVGGEPISCNRDELLKLDGVIAVVKITDGFAIVANTYWQADKARDQFKGTWNNPKELFDTNKYKKQCLSLIENYDGDDNGSDGEDYKKQDIELEAVYSVPFLAHAPLEPQNCTVDIKEDSATVWYSTQGPGMVKPLVSEITGLSESKIEVLSASVGGGFGRRSAFDSLVRATEIGVQVKKPVKLIYSREDDMKAGYYRPHVVTKIKASLDKGHRNIFYKQAVATQSLMEDTMPNVLVGVTPSWVSNGISRFVGRMMVNFADGTTVAEGAVPPYDFKGAEIRWRKTEAPIPIQWWRSVGHTQNGFFVESFADEIAHKISEDPMLFREKRLKKNSRQLAVLKKVKEMSGWGEGNRSLGVACHYSFKSYAAAVIEVEEVDQTMKIKKVWTALDCGRVLNPDAVQAQIMGSVIFGLTAALYGKMEVRDGKIIQDNFDSYRLLSLAETPEIETAFMESEEDPTGVGEPIVPVIAPALTNAIFKMSGKRHRELPILG